MPVVESSMMQHTDYRETTRELNITFRSGKTYTYFGVAPDVYKRLLAAESKGSFFHESIDGAYTYAVANRYRRSA